MEVTPFDATSCSRWELSSVWTIQQFLELCIYFLSYWRRYPPDSSSDHPRAASGAENVKNAIFHPCLLIGLLARSPSMVNLQLVRFWMSKGTFCFISPEMNGHREVQPVTICPFVADSTGHRWTLVFSGWSVKGQTKFLDISPEGIDTNSSTRVGNLEVPAACSWDNTDDVSKVGINWYLIKDRKWWILDSFTSLHLLSHIKLVCRWFGTKRVKILIENQEVQLSLCFSDAGRLRGECGFGEGHNSCFEEEAY